MLRRGALRDIQPSTDPVPARDHKQPPRVIGIEVEDGRGDGDRKPFGTQKHPRKMINHRRELRPILQGRTRANAIPAEAWGCGGDRSGEGAEQLRQHGLHVGRGRPEAIDAESLRDAALKDGRRHVPDCALVEEP